MDQDEIDAREQQLLDGLEQRFLKALADKDEGRLDDAEDALRDILKIEPRLPEAHMELARLLLDTDRVADAEPYAREAITWFEQGGQWTDEVPEHVLQGLAHGLLAEILRRRADDDDVIFGDPAAFRALVDEAKKHFARAAELDPSDEYSSYHAFFLGVPGAQPTIGAVDVDAAPDELEADLDGPDDEIDEA